jgi:hypothetical protein
MTNDIYFASSYHEEFDWNYPTKWVEEIDTIKAINS